MPRLSARETRHLGQISLDIPLVAFALGPRQIPAQRSTTVARAAPPTDVLQRLLPRLQPAPAQAVPRLMPRAAAAVTRSLRTRVARVSVSCTQITRPQLWWILAVPRHVPHEPTLEAENRARTPRLVKRLPVKIPRRPRHLPVLERIRVPHLALVGHEDDARRNGPAVRVQRLERWREGETGGSRRPFHRSLNDIRSLNLCLNLCLDLPLNLSLNLPLLVLIATRTTATRVDEIERSLVAMNVPQIVVQRVTPVFGCTR